jgi:hypothetical protein
MYDSKTLTGGSTFSGSYTPGRLVAVQNLQFQPGQSTSPSEIEPTEMYAYTQGGQMSGKRLQVNETISTRTLKRNLGKLGDGIPGWESQGQTARSAKDVCVNIHLLVPWRARLPESA